MENCTVGFSIFRKVYLRMFNFLTFIFQGPHFYKNSTLGLSKVGLFYTSGLGVMPNILTPGTFYWKSSLGVGDSFPLEID